MKGTTNNPHGRPKGVPNKITTELRSRINEFLNNEWDAIIETFKSLQPKERLIFYERLLAYSLPKANSISDETAEADLNQVIFNETRSYSIDLDSIPYEDLKQMILQSEVFMKSNESGEITLLLPK